MEESVIIKTLINAGFSRNETLVYIDLIRTGKSTATDIAKRTQIHRSNVYDVMTSLKQKGLVSESTMDDTNYFYPTHPRNILEFHKQEQHEIERIIPEIEKIINISQEERKVTVSRGLNSVKSVLLSLLELNQPMYVYGTPKDAVEILGPFIKEFHSQRIKKRIPLYHIYGGELLDKVKALNKMNFTESRYLRAFESPTSTNICGDKVVIILWDEPIEVITIKSSENAETSRNYFKILWENSQFIR